MGKPGKPKPPRKHDDTTVSLHPLTFEEAIRELANSPKHKDSKAEWSGKVIIHKV